jgi:hypothetical protein
LNNFVKEIQPNQKKLGNLGQAYSTT